MPWPSHWCDAGMPRFSARRLWWPSALSTGTSPSPSSEPGLPGAPAVLAMA